MTEPTPPTADTPAPAGQPQPTSAPVPEQPVKKRGGGRIVSIVVLVLIVGAGLFFRFGLQAIEDSRWKEGACLDYYPTSIVEFDVKPTIVDCSSANAKSRIVGVFGADATIERDCQPLNSVATVTRDDKTYCLVES